MRFELPIKPRRSGLLRSHTEEIGIWVAGEAVKLFSVVVNAVTVMTVAGFEWPGQTHVGLFSILSPKSKQGCKHSHRVDH
jgi:hypothetical protein